MPIPTPVTYPLDLTGTSPDNLIQGEPQTLSPNRAVRAVAPMYGGFYKDSMAITDMANGNQLTASQFECVELYEVPTALTGKEVDSVVLITDTAVSNNIQLTYQCVGGEYSRSPEAIVDLVNTLELDNRPAAWPDIIGLPSQFPPSMHLHDAGDIFGFEYVVWALERVRRAIEMGDDISHDNIYRYIDGLMANIPTLANVLAMINTALANHVASPDPHSQYRLKLDITEQVAVINATTSITSIDLSLGAAVYIVNVQADTLLQFINPPGGFSSFGLITVNDSVAGHALAMPTGVKYAGGFIPPRSTGAGAIDEWWFSRQSSASPWVGSLAVKDAK